MELGDRQPIAEVYTIGQVAEATGVPENTIRSWERRFGIPRPARSGGNQRRYGERDVETIRSIQASRVRGRTMDQAIQDLAREAIAPGPAKLPEPQQEEDAPGAGPGPAPSTEGAVERLLSALLAHDGQAAEGIVADAMWGTTVESTCTGLLLPAAQAIDVRQAAGDLPAHATGYSTSWLHRKLVAALDHSSPDTGRLMVAVAALHDASGATEALCLAIVLSRAGFRIVWPGDGVPVADLVDFVEAMSPGVVVMAGRSHLSTVAVASAIDHLRGRRGSGAWRGVIAVTGGAATGDDVIALPIHATATVDLIDDALRTNDPSLRLVRKR